MLTREERTHIHVVPGYTLPGVKRAQVCMPNDPQLRRDLESFKRVWIETRRVLASRNLECLADGIYIVFTGRRGYYARFWRGNIMIVNLRDFLAQGRRARGILIHELGHRVWFHVAQQKTRARWAADHHFRMKNGGAKHGSFVSEYAKRNALEDHAETFRERVEGTLRTRARTRYERLGPVTRTIRQRMRAA
jgi:hypothetical protein